MIKPPERIVLTGFRLGHVRMIQNGIALPEKLIPVLHDLVEASRYAIDTQCSNWDFAVPICRLISLGANESDLRWLAQKNFVSHAREVTVEGDDGRDFRPTGNLTFCEKTCFVLTEVGGAAFKLQGLCCNQNQESPKQEDLSPKNSFCLKPSWEPDARKLLLGMRIVKRFKWPASNQEAVLCAFQEENWPERIDDPLKPHPDQNPKRRLADTIKCLNRKQVNALIQFHGDGTGEGVVWERVASKDACRNA